MLILIMVKNLRKLNFDFADVTFSPTLTMLFFFFLTISKINVKLSNDIKLMKKKFLIHFIIKSLLYVFKIKFCSNLFNVLLFCFSK